MRRASEIRTAGTWNAATAIDRVVLDADERHRRRIALTGEQGTAFLLDLPHATALRRRRPGARGWRDRARCRQARAPPRGQRGFCARARAARVAYRQSSCRRAGGRRHRGVRHSPRPSRNSGHVANSVSAGVRLVPLKQTDGQRVLARTRAGGAGDRRARALGRARRCRQRDLPR